MASIQPHEVTQILPLRKRHSRAQDWHKQRVAYSTWCRSVSKISVVVVDDLELPSTVIHLPWWFPGAGFKKDAGMWKRKLDRCRDEPYEAVKRSLVRIVLHHYPSPNASQGSIRKKTGLFLR